MEPLPPLEPAGVEEIVRCIEQRRPDLADGLEGLRAVYQVLCETFERGQPLYLCGNGGSFADALHIKAELGKAFLLPRPVPAELADRLRKTPLGTRLAENLERGFPVIVLGESHALRSAYANDRDAELVYAQELYSLAAHLPGGAMLAISTSGRSRNILAATTLANAMGLRTIAFTGPGDNPLAELARVRWQVPGGNTPEVQENQVVLYHALCRMLETRFFPR